MTLTKLKKKLEDIGNLINDSLSDKRTIIIVIGIWIVIVIPQ